MKTPPSRARTALFVAIALLLAGCSSATTGARATQSAPRSASPAATYSATPEATTAAPLPDAQRWLPAKHLAPAGGWTSNPSGLVYENGTYHAFYRHNPGTEDIAGAVDWAHATSTDLVTWTEQPVAIPGSADAQVLTGSVVVDTDNTSGLGTDTEPPMVAIYTNVVDDSQSLAYSTDHGQTWQQYSGNPVLDSGISGENLRDPKVFWYEPGGYWVLVAAVAEKFAVELYKSKTLKNWTYLSEVTGVGSQAGPWESPDLFPLALDGDPTNIKWVMPVSIRTDQATDAEPVAETAAGDSAAPIPPKTAGPSVQYFVGSFDGATFTPEPLGPAGVGAPQPGEMFSWMDWGADFDIGNNVQRRPGRPDGGTRLAEQLAVRRCRPNVTEPWGDDVAAGLVPEHCRRHPPAAGVDPDRGGNRAVRHPARLCQGFGPHHQRQPQAGQHGERHQFADPGNPRPGCGAGVRDDGARLVHRQDRYAHPVRHRNRDPAGRPDVLGTIRFLPGVLPGSAAPIALTDGKLTLRIVVDGDSVEVFAGDGKAVITSLVFPAAGDDDVALFAGGGKATVENVSVTHIGG